MRIAVCIKQVPVVAAMELDATTKTLKREGVPSEVSPFDVRALIKAVELRAAHGGEVVVVTMGPPAAREALLECLALGADAALHLNDRAFAGSDTLATARALAAALRREPFDLILCGRNSVDAETGHIGPQIAAFLDLPQITCARTLEVEGGRVHAERELEDGTESVCAAMPVLVTAAEDLAPEKFPSKADREAAKNKPIVELRAQDLGVELGEFGSAGSPTWVDGLHAVANTRMGRILEGDTPEALARSLAEILTRDHGLFGTAWKVAEPEAIARLDKPATVPAPGAVWVLAETRGGQARPATLELLGRARVLADALGKQVIAVGVEMEDAPLTQLAEAGADRLLHLRHPDLAAFDAETWTSAFGAAIERERPAMILFGASSLTRDLAPRLAARLQVGLTSDCVDLGLDREGRLIQYKPAFGGLIVAPILSKTLPAMATVRPGMLGLAVPSMGRSLAVEDLSIPDLAPARLEVRARQSDAGAATELDSAEVIVGVGHGLGGADKLPLLQPLKETLGAAYCTTRDVTDEGWLPKQLQVGITGRAIAPKLYIAIAIRGAFEHMVGVRRAGIVVAINKSPKAPVFKSADYGIVGDYTTIVPALLAELAARKGRRPA